MPNETIVNASIASINYQVTIEADGHIIIADEPIEHHGGNTGMYPNQLLLSSLGACTAITLKMYIQRKQWNVGNVSVELSLVNNSGITDISRKITYSEYVTEEQRQRLLQIANACPVHKVLTGKISIITK